MHLDINVSVELDLSALNLRFFRLGTPRGGVLGPMLFSAVIRRVLEEIWLLKMGITLYVMLTTCVMNARARRECNRVPIWVDELG